MIMGTNATDLEVVHGLVHVPDRDHVEETIVLAVTVVRCPKVVRDHHGLVHIPKDVRLRITNHHDMIDPELEVDREVDRDLNQEIDEEKIDAINQKKDNKTTKMWLIM